MSRRALIAVGVFLLLLMAYQFGWSFWEVKMPQSCDPPVCSDIRDMYRWKSRSRGDAAKRLAQRGALAAPAASALIDHLNDFGFSEGLRAGVSKMFSYHGGPKQVSTEAYLALQAIGSPAVPALIAGLGDREQQVRMSCAELLGRAQDVRALSALRAAEHEQSASVRCIARTALARLNDPETLKGLERQLHDADLWNRVNAAQMCGSSGSRYFILPLIASLDDRDDIHVQTQISIALALITGKNFGVDAERWRLWLASGH